MYIQITDHCNMTCAHCCYSCSPRKKNFITMRMFEAALDMLGDPDEPISIGGGEPTLHFNFWGILGMAMGASDHVWMATNGSQTKTTLRLAKMAGRGVIGCALSQDHFHTAIDDAVINAFKGADDHSYRRADDDLREIRNVSSRVMRQGRAIRTGTWQEEGCGCDDILIDPLGNIWSCGCKKLLLGHVLTGWNEAGKRRRSFYQHTRWQDIDLNQCYFTGEYRKEYRRAFAAWLKDGRMR